MLRRLRHDHWVQLMVAPYPLTWPEGIPRWKHERQAGQFKASLSAAMGNVETSLRLFGSDSGKPVTNMVISSNVTLGVNRPADPGVAIWFTWDGLSVAIPVDRYSKVEANLQAIHHVLEARRTEMRHGTLALVRAAMAGFAQLPPPSSKPTWRVVMKLNGRADITPADVESRFKALTKQRHPDVPGGSAEAMAELIRAREEALKELK